MPPEWIFYSQLCWQYNTEEKIRTTFLTQWLGYSKQAPNITWSDTGHLFWRSVTLPEGCGSHTGPVSCLPASCECLRYPRMSHITLDTFIYTQQTSVKYIRHLSKIYQMAPETQISSCHCFLSFFDCSELLRSDMFITVVISEPT